MKKVISVFALLTIFIVFSPKKALSQGTCTCLYDMTTNSCSLTDYCQDPDYVASPCVMTTPGMCPGCNCVTPTPTVVITPPPGLQCCDALRPCPPGLVCESFSPECALSGYPMSPNLCVREILPTPIPGSGCNYEECRNDNDCDQVSNCRCLGYISGIQLGLCYPPETCGGFIELCCDPPTDPCQGSLEPVNVEMTDSIEVCFCFLGPGAPPPVVTPPMKCTPQNQSNQSGIDTAIGCIPVLADTMHPFTRFLLVWSLGIAGGIAFILIVVAGFMITTAAGNPQKLQASKELLMAALAGLLMVIFSVFILRVIGFDILRIPGF